MNAYPRKFLDKIIIDFINRERPQHQEENYITLCLPYFGHVSDIMKRKIKSLCNRHNLAVRIVFKPFKVSNYFSLKSRVPLLLRSGVVYRYTCSDDPSYTYIGRTSRHLIKRIKEHGDPRTASAITQHRLICNFFQ